MDDREQTQLELQQQRAERSQITKSHFNLYQIGTLIRVYAYMYSYVLHQRIYTC
jgi:hypothetical protein